MKKRIILIFTALLFLAGCKMNVDEMISSQKKKNTPNNGFSAIPLTTGFSSRIDIPEENYPNPENIKKGYSIIKTTENFDKTVFSGFGGIIKGTQNFNDGYTYWLVYSSDPKTLRYMLNKMPNVAYAEPEYEVTPVYSVGKDTETTQTARSIEDSGNIIADPQGYLYEWALKTTKARNYVENGVEKDGAYKTCGYGSNETVIAIIDTGINMNHQDFKDSEGNSIVLYAKSAFNHSTGNYNQINTGKLRVVPVPSNEDGGAHGTHCSGTMCAVGDNKVGISGVAYKKTKLISYKGLGNNGSGSYWAIYGALGDMAKVIPVLKKPVAERTPEDKAIITDLPEAAQKYHITQTTVPVNMSLGGGAITQYVVEMVNKALSANILPVIAMGNEGRTISAYPAGIEGVLSVGATTINDKKANFSDSGPWINISAPGHNIISCWNGPWTMEPPVEGTDTNGINYMNGTSMATPYITGTLGYLLSFDEARKLTPYQLQRILEITADKIDSEDKYQGYTDGYSKYYGYGRVNVLEAAKCVTGKDGAQPIPEAGAFYAEKPMTIKITNTGFGNTSPLEGKLVYLYENKTGICSSIGVTNKNGEVDFYGLKVGKNYIAKINEYDTPMKHEFEASNDGGLYTFAYNKNIVFISTCPNEAFPDTSSEPWTIAGLNKPWLVIQVFNKNDTENNTALSYGFYPSTDLLVESDQEYYVTVCAWKNGVNYEGGNYGLYIGKELKTSINNDDGGRLQAENDSHESNNTFEEADAKFTDNIATRPNGYWEVDIAGNLLPNAENPYTNGGEVDIYKFTIPE